MDENISFFQRPVVRAFMGFVYFIIGYLALWLLLWAGQTFYADSFPAQPVQITYLTQFADMLICVIGLGMWLVFFAQFVLPVKTFRDRLHAVDRLVTYISGGHGPALFIENGAVRAREGEQKKRGPGVIWLDSASAAVLRTSVKFTRTVGPGVHFTRGDEYIAATTDLHTLTQTIGPGDGDVDDKDPFKVSKDKFPEDYDAIQKRRWETSGMTRDGIEVLASISVNFRIKSSSDEGNTRFGFNPENTEKAIRDSIIRGAMLDQPVWSPLPAKMAADVWREYLRKFRLSELFEIVEGRSETTVQVINNMMVQRLSRPKVTVLDDFGRVVLEDEFRDKEYRQLLKDGKKEEAEKLHKLDDSTEYGKLAAMGLEVKSVLIKRLVFAPDIEDRLISQWTTLWKKNAEKERDQMERDRKLSETHGQQDALKEFALESSREISQVQADNKPHALEMLVHSTFRGVQRNSSLLKRTNTEQRELSDIFNWLRNRRGPLT